MDQHLPLYAQLKAALTAAISRGELAPGDRLPSQRELCRLYGMSHMTVRRAINDLLHDGTIYAIPSKGTFVAEKKQVAESGPLVSFTDDMARLGMHSSSVVLESRLIGASAILAQALGVAASTPLVYLRRLRLADGEPMAIQSSHLPHAICPGLLEHDLERGSLFAVLRTVYGLRLTGSSTTIEAAVADPLEAELLGLSMPAALLTTEQITFLDDGRAIELVRSAYRGDRYRLKFGES